MSCTHNEGHSSQITGHLQVPLGHLLPVWYHDLASDASYTHTMSALQFSKIIWKGSGVPNLLTMYRPSCPVAPKTVAVCPINSQSDNSLAGVGMTRDFVPPSADLFRTMSAKASPLAKFSHD